MKRRGFVARAIAFVSGSAMAASSDLGFAPAKATASSDALPRHASLRYTYVDDDGQIATHEAVYNPDGTVMEASQGAKGVAMAAVDFNFDRRFRVIRWVGETSRIHSTSSLYSYEQQLLEDDLDEGPMALAPHSRGELYLADDWTIELEALAHIAGIIHINRARVTVKNVDGALNGCHVDILNGMGTPLFWDTPRDGNDAVIQIPRINVGTTRPLRITRDDILTFRTDVYIENKELVIVPVITLHATKDRSERRKA